MKDYDHEEVLRNNTKESTPSELRSLRIFAAIILIGTGIIFKWLPIGEAVPKGNGDSGAVPNIRRHGISQLLSEI